MYTLWDFSRDQYSKILITGRPNFFLDQLERERSLNVRPESIEIPYTLPLYLCPFEIDQIESALRAFSDEIRTQIIELVRDGVAASFRRNAGRVSRQMFHDKVIGFQAFIKLHGSIRRSRLTFFSATTNCATVSLSKGAF